MADLKCGAMNCTYNEEQCCCKGDIMVGGKNAECIADTCCESFAQRRCGQDTYTSSLSHPGRTIGIDCEAVKCIYNSNYKCVAEHVDIAGSGAIASRETECTTFTER